jgi:FtsH-binding integral membrane protein
MPELVVLIYGSISAILFVLLIVFIVQRIKNKRLEDFEDRDY